MKDLLPWTGDREARKAWDELFSRDVLGSVVLGTSTGKFVEQIIELTVILFLGHAPIIFKVMARMIAWSVAIIVGIYVFTYWNKVQKKVQDKVEEKVEGTVEKTQEVLGEDSQTKISDYCIPTEEATGQIQKAALIADNVKEEIESDAQKK